MLVSTRAYQCHPAEFNSISTHPFGCEAQVELRSQERRSLLVRHRKGRRLHAFRPWRVQLEFCDDTMRGIDA